MRLPHPSVPGDLLPPSWRLSAECSRHVPAHSPPRTHPPALPLPAPDFHENPPARLLYPVQLPFPATQHTSSIPLFLHPLSSDTSVPGPGRRPHRVPSHSYT